MEEKIGGVLDRGKRTVDGAISGKPSVKGSDPCMGLALLIPRKNSNRKGIITAKERGGRLVFEDTHPPNGGWNLIQKISSRKRDRRGSQMERSAPWRSSGRKENNSALAPNMPGKLAVANQRSDYAEQRRRSWG